MALTQNILVNHKSQSPEFLQNHFRALRRIILERGMKKFEELKALVESLEDDMYRFHFKLNGAAGTRVRKAMQEIKTLAQQIRTEVQEMKGKE